MRIVLLLLTAALASTLLFVWWGRSSFVSLDLVVTVSLLLAGLLGLLAAALYAFKRRTMSGPVRLTLRILVMAAVFFGSTALGRPLVQRVIERDVRIAKKQVGNLVMLLSTRFATTRAYPLDLQTLGGKRTLPRLLDQPGTYQSTGTSYTFRIRIPGSPAASEIFRSEDPVWHTIEPADAL